MRPAAPCILFLLCFWANATIAQVTGIVKDKATGRPVPYANIWVENENLGTTSDGQGKFIINNSSLNGKTLIVSCIGYERSNVLVQASSLAIALQPTTVALQEVTVRKSTQRRKAILNKLDDDTQYSFGSNGTPWIVAQYFPYQKAYANTPFLDEVALVTLSNIKRAKFKMRLLAVNEKGEPGQDLLSKPLLVTAPKGIKKLHVNLSDHDLQVPAKGFFVAFEWLIIPENRFEPVNEETGLLMSPALASYEPSIRTRRPSSQTHHGWIYDRGQWRPTDVKQAEAILYAIPHFQVTLSD